MTSTIRPLLPWATAAQLAMARIGYARVSTVDQDLEAQLARLKAERCGVIRSKRGLDIRAAKPKPSKGVVL